MCRFYSFLTDEKGNRYTMNHQIRLDIKSGKSDLREDSHASIAELWNIDEDKCNKYEFNPLTRELVLDMQNLSFNDKELIDIDELINEVKKAVPELIIKPIINPLKDIKFEGEVTDDIIGLVQEWSEVRNSVWSSVGSSVWNFIWNSVGDVIYAYISSFFNINYPYDYSSAIKLWNMGLVPSFDGKTWRLHSCKGIVWEGKL